MKDARGFDERERGVGGVGAAGRGEVECRESEIHHKDTETQRSEGGSVVIGGSAGRLALPFGVRI